MCSKNRILDILELEKNTGFQLAAFVYFYAENQDYKYYTEISQH